jgi:hypothetical protein
MSDVARSYHQHQKIPTTLPSPAPLALFAPVYVRVSHPDPLPLSSPPGNERRNLEKDAGHRVQMSLRLKYFLDEKPPASNIPVESLTKPCSYLENHRLFSDRPSI